MAVEKKATAGTWFCEQIAMAAGFMDHWRDVYGGAIRADSACGIAPEIPQAIPMSKQRATAHLTQRQRTAAADPMMVVDTTNR